MAFNAWGVGAAERFCKLIPHAIRSRLIVNPPNTGAADGAGLGMRIAIAHVCMGRGGSESKVMWGIQALKDDHSVTLITAGRVGPRDLDDLNHFYGTSLIWGDFRVAEGADAALHDEAVRPAAALRGALFQRFCRKVAPQFDVLVSAYGPCDFGVPAIHCIADFSWDEEIRRRFDPMPLAAKRMIHRDVPAAAGLPGRVSASCPVPPGEICSTARTFS